MATKKSSGPRSMKVSIGRKDYPTKQVINFIMDDHKAENKTALRGFCVFMVILVVFVYIGVLRPLANINKLQGEYNNLEAKLAEYQLTSSQFGAVQEEYNQKMSMFMTDDELLCLDRPDIVEMITEDIVPNVTVLKVEVSADSISVEAKADEVSALNDTLVILQSDSRIYYATITTISEETDQETGDKFYNGNYTIQWNSNSSEEVSTDAES